MSDICGPAGLTGDTGGLPKDEWHRFGIAGLGELRLDKTDDMELPGLFWDGSGDRNRQARGGMGEPAARLSGPIRFTRELITCWRLENLDASRLLGFGTGDLDEFESLLVGRRELRGRDIRDRIMHLFHIRKTLWSLFRSLNVENDWLREEHELLDGTSPLSLMLEGSMANLLLVRDYVESAAGIR